MGLVYEHRFAVLIRNTISSQVSGRAQLPDVLKYNVDKEFNPRKSGGLTSRILTHPNANL